MTLRKNSQGAKNTEEFKEMLAHCRKLICEIVVELEDASEAHEAAAADDGPLHHLFWVEGHLLAALYPCDFKGAEERSEQEKEDGPPSDPH